MIGFGRSIFATGDYYIGWCKFGFPFGYGKLVFADGSVQEGLFDNGEFVGDSNNKMKALTENHDNT